MRKVGLLVLLFFTAASYANEVKVIDEFNEKKLKSVIKINPMYPEYAKKNSVEGQCMVDFFIDTKGGVIANKTVATCSPENIFEESCSKAINLRKFINYTKSEQQGRSQCFYRK